MPRKEGGKTGRKKQTCEETGYEAEVDTTTCGNRKGTKPSNSVSTFKQNYGDVATLQRRPQGSMIDPYIPFKWAA
jgi:hypothetical protein